MAQVEETLKWDDAHFCSLPSQANIYSLQKLKTENGTNKFLASSLDSSFLSVEYQKIDDRVTPLTKNIPFTHIPAPGEAEIVSIDAFTRLPPKKGLVVGITYVMILKTEAEPSLRSSRNTCRELNFSKDAAREKGTKRVKQNVVLTYVCTDHWRKVGEQPQEQEPRPKNQVLNIYSEVLGEDEQNSGKERKLEFVSDSCKSISLTFIPFVLTNTEIVVENGIEEKVFLLSGSDFKIHVFREQPDASQDFMEVPSRMYFPEFDNLHDSVLHLAITKPDIQHRLTAVGFTDGTCKVHLINIKSKDILNEWSSSMDGPVTSLHFFSQQKVVPCPSFLENLQDDCSLTFNANKDPPLTQMNLLMTTALNPSIVYRNVLTSGLSEFLYLPDSEKFDAPMCSLAADVDFDSQNEVLVGTYGQELLAYKFFHTREKLVPVSGPGESLLLSPHSSLSGGSGTPPYTSTPVVGSIHEPGKHRHKSDEGSSSEKSPSEQRKVKSQENLLRLMGERSLDPAFVAERRDDSGEHLELRTVAEPHYQLLWKRQFPCPVMQLDSGDMMGDGLENLAVLTTHGLHILQPDLNQVADLVTSRLQQLCALVPDEGDEFHKLQSE